MLSRILLVVTAAASLAAADTLILKSGRSIQGTYLGGDARQIRVAVGDRVDVFDIGEVSEIRFGSAPAQPARPPAAAAAEPAQERPRIMRPERPITPAASASAAPARSSAATFEIPAGTAVVVRMIDDVDSERDRVGQTFRASIDEPVVIDGRTVIPRGADVTAKLVEDKQSGRLSGRTELTMDLVALTINGRSVDLLTEEVTTSSESRTGRTGKVVGGTAALGAIIGAIAGGGKGAAIGAVTGAGAGAAVQVMTKGQRVRIPSETRLTFNLQQPVRI